MTKVTTQSRKNAPAASKNCGSGKCTRGGVKSRVLTPDTYATSTAVKPKGKANKKKRSIDVTGVEAQSKKQKQNSMTVKELKAALDAAGIPYEKSAKKADLQKIYDIYKIVQKPSTVDLTTSVRGKAVKSKAKKQDSVAPKGANAFKSMLDDCGIAYDVPDDIPFTDTVCGVVDAAMKCSEKKQIEMIRMLIQNVKKMYMWHMAARDYERIWDRVAAGLEPDAEPYMWCLLIAAKIITSWDELLTEIGNQYNVESNGELEPFHRYLDVVDTADALYKKKLISNFQYGIVTGDGTYKANKKDQKASWEVLTYLFDQENRFEDDTWDELVKHGKKLHPITEDAMNMMSGVSNKKRNSNTKRKPVSNGAKQFYKNQQKHWTKDELVAECKRRKIPYSGSKLKLMERCRQYENKLNRDSDCSDCSSSDSSDYSSSSSDSEEESSEYDSEEE